MAPTGLSGGKDEGRRLYDRPNSVLRDICFLPSFSFFTLFPPSSLAYFSYSLHVVRTFAVTASEPTAGEIYRHSRYGCCRDYSVFCGCKSVCRGGNARLALGKRGNKEDICFPLCVDLRAAGLRPFRSCSLCVRMYCVNRRGRGGCGVGLG